VDAELGVDELTRVLGRVFVINLLSRRDRYLEMGGQLRKVGLGWESSRVTHVAAVRPSGDAGFPSVGAHGCFMSHLSVLEQAINAGLESILILEDDCNFVHDISARMGAVNAALECSDWSLFYGGYHLYGVPAPRPQPGSPILEVAPEQPVWLAHCLALRGQALQALPDYLRAVLSRPPGHADGGRMDVDGAYSWFRRAHPHLKTYIANPQIAYQRSSRTDISELSWRDRLPLVRLLMAAGRKVLNLRHR